MKRWMTLLLVVALGLVMTACGAPDPAKEAKKVVAKVANTEITKGEAQAVYDLRVYFYLVDAYQQGQTVDKNEAEFISYVKEETLNIMAEELAMEKMLDKFGVGLTEEEKAEIETSTVEQYETAVQSVVTQQGVTDIEARQVLKDDGITQDGLMFLTRQAKVQTKLMDYATTDVTVSEEEIQKAYDERVAEESTHYAEDANGFAQEFLGGETIYVRPEGYRYVKGIVIALPEEFETKIAEKNTVISEKQNEYYTLLIKQMSETELPEEEKTQLAADITAKEAELDTISAEADELIKQGQEQNRPHAEEVLALCKAEGADFDALIAQYSSDYTPETAALLTNGYPVSAGNTNYVTAFTDAAMALTTVGEVSGLVESVYGFHILKYTGDVPVGPVPLAEVHDGAQAVALDSKQNTVFQEKITTWLKDYTIKTYLYRF